MRIAFFFDGTGNNQTNSIKNHLKYGNVTNISKLFKSCNVNDKFYIEGIGTIDNEEDSQWALATGNNPMGYKGYSYEDKLNKGINLLNSVIKNNPNSNIELIIYGFSRGATLARDFSKRALKNSNVKIEYIGIFDTVVSLLTLNPEIHFNQNELNRIDQILHLCAIQECRSYFPLTSINTTTNNKKLILEIKDYYTDKIKEVFVPGAHADVGGGYIPAKESVYLNEVRDSCDSLTKKLMITKKTVVDHFSGSSNYVWDKLLGENVSCQSAGWVGFNLVSQRDIISIDLSDVYFKVMASNTNQLLKDNIFTFDTYVNDPNLLKLFSQINLYLIEENPKGGPNFNEYNDYLKYIHISSNYGNIDKKSINSTLNTFNPTLLSLEIENIKQTTNNNLNLYRQDMVFSALGINPAYVNQPNNDKWERKVIYG